MAFPGQLAAFLSDRIGAELTGRINGGAGPAGLPPEPVHR